MKQQELVTFVNKLGQKYSEMLGINVESRDDEEIFKWFLAAVLFGAPITETSVFKTYRCFERRGVLTSDKILQTGWEGLVEILDEGSYTRYDFKTADKLLEIMGNLKTRYGGSLNQVHQQAADSTDLENRLKELGKGIGDVTAGIFLRELRGIWSKANPKPTPLVVSAAKNLGIIRVENPEKALKELQNFWRKNAVEGKSFINFETALLRWGKILRRKERKSKQPEQNSFFTEPT